MTPGADSSKKEAPEVVADYTLKLLKRRVPPAVPGTGFLPMSWFTIRDLPFCMMTRASQLFQSGTQECDVVHLPTA